MEFAELQCCVCDTDYNDHQLPRNLACGHSVCSTCLDLLIPISKRCPECRGVFTESKSSDLPINYPLLRLSRLVAHERNGSNTLPELKFPISLTEGELQQNAGICTAHGSSLFFMCISCDTWVCRDCLIVDHPDPPRGKCYILSVKDGIEKIKRSHISCMDEYMGKFAVSVRCKLQKNLEIIETAMKNFENTSDEMEMEENPFEELKKQKQAIEESLTNLDNEEKSLINAKERISVSNTPLDITGAMELATASQSSFEKFLEKEKERSLPDVLNLLMRGKKDLKELLEEGTPVYAVTKQGNMDKWSKIVLSKNHLHLYSLRDGIPDTKGVILPFDLVRKLVPGQSPMIFLEVGWGEEVKGHVYVRMIGDTPLGQQATILCSGEKGVSYRNSCFYCLSNREDKPYILHGGDYESNNGTAGRAVIDEITPCDAYLHNIKAGLFCSWIGLDSYKSASFNIYLSDLPIMKDFAAYGFVEQGLDILNEAAKVTPITDVKVMDCGLVIPT